MWFVNHDNGFKENMEKVESKGFIKAEMKTPMYQRVAK